jgi:dihydroorotase
VFDPRREWTVDPARFHSKGRNTPYAGWTLHGRATCTIVGGRVVYRLDDARDGERGRGGAGR